MGVCSSKGDIPAEDAGASLHDIVRMLASSHALVNLSDEQLRRVAVLCSVRQLEPGEQLVGASDTSSSLFFVGKGESIGGSVLLFRYRFVAGFAVSCAPDNGDSPRC